MIQDRDTASDNRYNRTAVIDETGRRWTFVYDERKNVVRSTGPDQVRRRYEWGEEYNQLRSVQIDGISGAWVYSYDQRGNLTAAADPDGGALRVDGQRRYRETMCRHRSVNVDRA